MNWAPTRLKHLAEIRVSTVDKKSLSGQLPVRLCNYTDVYYRDAITPDQTFMEATATSAQIAAFRLRPGDVIITKDSESPQDIGVPAFVAASAPDLICGYHLAILRPRAEQIDGRFLHWALSSRPARAQFECSATGVTRFGLRSDAIANVALAAPPLEEQRRIATFLDDETARITRILDLQQRLLAALPRRTRAVTHAALAGLSRNARLAYAVRWLSGGTPPRDDPGSWDGDFPWVSSKDLWVDRLVETSEQIDRAAAEMHSTVAPAGTVLIATRGMSLAKRLPLAIIEQSMAFNQDLKALVPLPPLTGDYLRIVLRAFEDEILSLVVEAAHGTRRLETKDLKALRFPLPPPSDQRRKVDEVREVEHDNSALATRITRNMALLHERRDALVTAAVGGELDPSSYRTEAALA